MQSLCWGETVRKVVGHLVDLEQQVEILKDHKHTIINNRIYAHMFTKTNYLMAYKESLEILKDCNSSSDVSGPSDQAQHRLRLGSLLNTPHQFRPGHLEIHGGR